MNTSTLRHPHLSLAFLAASLALPACADPHILPRLKPLFGGLDEAMVPVSSRLALMHAREDFQLARHGKKPHYAEPAGTIPYTHSQVFQGDGYRLTMVHNDLVNVLLVGPEIVLESKITHGAPYRYDEIERIGED